MKTGPLINNPKITFTSESSLGIETISTSMSNVLCPVISGVTSKPFYWAFRCWCYYDLLKNKEKITNKDVNAYYKRVNYFLCLGSILAGKREDGGFVGSQYIYRDVNLKDNEFEYKENYLGTMTQLNYYKTALEDLNLIGIEEDNKKVIVSKCDIGMKIADAFDEIISKTGFYKYRFEECAIPRKTLIELGNSININFIGFDKCKEIFRNILFHSEQTKRIAANKEYICFLHKNSMQDLSDKKISRYLLFVQYATQEKREKMSESLKNVSIGWELVLGRQYYSKGLEIMWKYMLRMLIKPMNVEEWINECLNNSKFFSLKLEEKVKTVKDNYIFDFDEYDRKIIEKEQKSSDDKSMENGLKLIFAMYNRFKDREDISDLTDVYSRDTTVGPSLFCIQNNVERFNDKKVSDFLKYVMRDHIINQHLKTAYNKLPIYDGFFIIENDGKYIKREDYRIDFPLLKTTTVYSIVKDLDALYE